MRTIHLMGGSGPRLIRRVVPVSFVLATILLVSANLMPASAQYKVTNLVSNQAGVAAHRDKNHLINAWGLVALPGSPWWVSDNVTGFSTVYSANGSQVPLFVKIPPAPGSPAGTTGTPTGTVGNISNNGNDFTIRENGNAGQAIFIFATLDGTISGWNPGVDGISNTGASHATIAVDRSSLGASYTGLTIAINNKGQTLLYAADGGPNRRVDMFDGSFGLVKSFSDPSIPKNFTTYGIANFDDKIWVTYTSLDNSPGGFVDVFNEDGTLDHRFASQGPLNSPWGIALAPFNFGAMSNAILISNNTPAGVINAFNVKTGAFLGPLRDEKGNTIHIDQVWGLHFGLGQGANGPMNQLFFTGGPGNYGNGIFGVITVDH